MVLQSENSQPITRRKTMAKRTSNVSDEPVRTDLNFGELDTATEQQLKEVDPLQNLVTFVPGKPGYEAGQILAGHYVGTKRVYSEKFTAGKKDKDGRQYRDLHILRNPKNGKFGIWSVGSLGFVMEKMAPNELISIEYVGLAEKALKPGQNPPHVFKFRGVNLELDTATMTRSEEIGDEVRA
jgi:hypothetical protein